MSASGSALLASRCVLVILFLPFSALDKLLNFSGAVRQAREVFPPRVAVVAIVIGFGIEVLMSLGVVSGVADRAAALVLAGYCAATAVLFKRFWAAGDFWSDPGGKGRSLFWDFLKNLSLGAGFLLVTIGADGSGLEQFLSHPLASSQPYARYAR